MLGVTLFFDSFECLNIINFKNCIGRFCVLFTFCWVNQAVKFKHTRKNVIKNSLELCSFKWFNSGNIINTKAKNVPKYKSVTTKQKKFKLYALKRPLGIFG